MSKILLNNNRWNELKDILTDWLIVGHGEEVGFLNRVLDIMDELEQKEKEIQEKKE